MIPINCAIQTTFPLCLSSTFSSLEPNAWTSILYLGTVDGTRILLAATVPTLRLVRYIIPVPVLGLGRKPSPLGLGLGRGDCDRAVTDVDRVELGGEAAPEGGMNSVCVPPGETTGACARLGPVFIEIVRSLSWSCTFRLYAST